jgi:serine/threonine protein kinase
VHQLRTVNEKTAIQILYHSLKAQEWLTAHHICHNDLDESNIMISSADGKLYIIDFGLSYFTKSSISSIATHKSACRDPAKLASYFHKFTSRQLQESLRAGKYLDSRSLSLS